MSLELGTTKTTHFIVQCADGCIWKDVNTFEMLMDAQLCKTREISRGHSVRIVRMDSTFVKTEVERT